MTDCFAPAPRTVSLSESRMVQAVFVFVVVAALALAHIHLQFATRDLRMQHRKVQEKHQTLVQEESRILHEIEAECDSVRLRAFGREMEMVETDVRSQAVASIPESLNQKYLGTVERSKTETVLAGMSDPVVGDLGMKQILFKLADVNKAFAGQQE